MWVLLDASAKHLALQYCYTYNLLIIYRALINIKLCKPINSWYTDNFRSFAHIRM